MATSLEVCSNVLDECVFCNKNFNDETMYGVKYKYKGIVTHYYCLILSSRIEQKGEDDEGIFGFLYLDILNEMKRGNKLKCKYCNNKGATIHCYSRKCKAVFHLPCGLKNKSLHQFYDSFQSFCQHHRPKQKISNDILALAKAEDLLCIICTEKINLNDDSTLWAPCCKKNAFFHKHCIQKLALSFGSYAFKCPFCNNNNEFKNSMLKFGVYIPERDAAWEQEENAFNDLLYRHGSCDVKKCVCPKGRKYNKKNSKKWSIILCNTCGSQGVHIDCKLDKSSKWNCESCLKIIRGRTLNDSDECSDDESIENDSNSTNSRSRLHSGIRSNMQHDCGSLKSSNVVNQARVQRAPRKIISSRSFSPSSDDSSDSDSYVSNKPTTTLGIQDNVKPTPLSSVIVSSDSDDSCVSNKPATTLGIQDNVKPTPLSRVIVIESDDSDVEIISDLSDDIIAIEDENGKKNIFSRRPPIIPCSFKRKRVNEAQSDCNLNRLPKITRATATVTSSSSENSYRLPKNLNVSFRDTNSSPNTTSNNGSEDDSATGSRSSTSNSSANSTDFISDDTNLLQFNTKPTTIDQFFRRQLSEKRRSDNCYRLKKLRIVLTPIMLKIGKDNKIKVVQKINNKVSITKKDSNINKPFPIFLKSPIINQKNITNKLLKHNITVLKYSPSKKLKRKRTASENSQECLSPKINKISLSIFGDNSKVVKNILGDLDVNTLQINNFCSVCNCNFNNVDKTKLKKICCLLNQMKSFKSSTDNSCVGS